jgi:hypothetical protein
VQRKFFPRDKNYILEQAQLVQRDSMLHYLIDFVRVEYLMRCNPLGLADDTSIRIQTTVVEDLTKLHEFYLTLSGVFRYKHYSDNQLQFVFDGRDDFERYQEEWATTFRRWTRSFCQHDNFLKAILELTVLYPDDYTPQMAGLRLSYFITKTFDVKIDGAKGIVEIKSANAR